MSAPKQTQNQTDQGNDPNIDNVPLSEHSASQIRRVRKSAQSNGELDDLDVHYHRRYYG